MASIFICGDIVNYENEKGDICTPALAKIIADSDYAVCNFEAPVRGLGVPQTKSGTHHHQKIETLNGLKKQGFDLLLLANNHIMDFGKEGLSSTLDSAQKCGLDTIGAGLDFVSAYKPMVKEIDDVRVGMINGCEAQFGVLDYFERAGNAGYAWINHHEIDKLIIELKSKCDFVVVFSHAGLEHYEIPQKEWRERYRHFCDLGADVVAGSHSHVPQGYENHRGCLIFYSLGNFYFDSANYRNKEDRSYSVLLQLSRGKPIEFKPVYHHKQDGFVQLSPPEKQIDLAALCSRLGEIYQQRHDEMSLEVYEKVKHELAFSLMPIPYDGRIKSSLRRMASLLTGRSKPRDKELLQLHLLRNEAYYFATRHALEVITQRRHVRA